MSALHSSQGDYEKRTVYLHSYKRGMTRAQIDTWVKRDPDLTVYEHPGYIDILRDGVHVARYLHAQRVLRYEPRDQEHDEIFVHDDDGVHIVPPMCPACQREMALLRRRYTGGMFFGCPAFFEPKGCEETVDVKPRGAKEREALSRFYVQQERIKSRVKRAEFSFAAISAAVQAIGGQSED